MGGGPPRGPGMLSGPAAGPESQDRTLSVATDAAPTSAAARSAIFPEGLGWTTGASLLLRVSGSDEVFFFGLAVPGHEDAPVTNAPATSPHEDLAIAVAARMLRQMGWAP